MDWFSEVFESFPDAIVITAEDGHIVLVNAQTEKLFGYLRAELQGNTIEMLMPQRFRTRPLGQRADYFTRPRVRPMNSGLELYGLRKDSSEFPVEISLSSFKAKQGTLVVSAIRDMSERKQLAMLAALVKCSEDAIITKAPDHTIRTWNPGAEKLYGYSAEEAIGKAVTMLAPADRRDELDEMIDQVLQGETIHQYETRRRRKDGTLIDVSLSESPIRDSAGTIVGVATIARNVTERMRLQEQLMKREKYYKSLLSGSSDVISVADQSGAVLFASDSIQRVFGYRPDEVLGRQIFSFVHEDDAARAVERINTAGQSPNALIELRLRRKDNTWCDCEGSSAIIIGPDAESLLLINIRDISERKRAQQQIEKSEEYFKSLIQGSSDVVLVADLSGKILFAGGSQERIFQRTPEEVLGTMAVSYIHPDDLPEALRRMGELATKPHVLTENRLQRKDGTWCDCESTSELVTNRDGEKYIVLYIRDITERKRMERETALLAGIVNASQDAIINMSAEAKIITWNPAAEKAYGHTAEQAIGQGVELFVPLDELAQSLANIRNVVETGQPASWEQHGDSRDGTHFVSAINLFPIRDAAGNVTGVAGIGRDITERKQAECELIAAREAALAASRAKSEFLSSMSHEIRTPMNAVLGMAELLSETELSDEQRHYLEVMIANGNSLIELINSILDLARIESGRLQIEHTPFDLSELVEQTISTFGVRAHGKGLELAARIAPGVPDRLVGDPLRLRQILINLIGNAIKFTEVGEVVLDVERVPDAEQPGVLCFSVADTGIGIATDQLEAIFTSFTQADSSTTRKYGGTGLGLAIAQRLVSLMEGRISLESAVGKGSKFSFTARFGLAPRMISPKVDVVPSLAGYRVLVVDDNQINRLIVREMVVGCGAEVSEGDSGIAALAEMRRAKQAKKPYDIVLLDMRMPGMDGLAVARCIREEQLAQAPFILMLSSDDMRPQLTRLGELGLDAYLVKPITRKQLFAAIHRLLEQANRHTSDVLPMQGVMAAAPEQAITGRSRRILVAEDSPDNRLLISAYLKREPCTVDFAEDGEQAIAQFIAHDDYDMIFMDIQMPRMDGLRATRRIRQLEAEQGCRPLPIIALTASALDEDVARALAAGCNLHISKPVKKRVLLDTIRTAAFISATAQPPTPLTATVTPHSNGTPLSQAQQRNREK